MKTVFPGRCRGRIDAPPSKSAAHRALIAAALSDAPTEIELGGVFGEDVAATLDCLPGIGAEVRLEKGIATVFPGRKCAGNFPCRESGSTLRFLLPVAGALGAKGVFSGSGRLPERPLESLLGALESVGVKSSSSRLPLSLSGDFRRDLCVELPGNESSQYVTGFLFAYAALGGGKLRLVSALQSADYVRLTAGILRRFGIGVSERNGLFTVSGRFVSPGRFAVEGDWSNGAFYLALGAMTGNVAVSSLDRNSLQGDRRIVELLRRFGAKIACRGNVVTAGKSELCGAGDIDADATIDLVPVLAVVAAKAKGRTRFVNAGRLRLKESDRLRSVCQMLVSLGADAKIEGDALLVDGKGVIPGGGVVSGAGDHRIVMAAAIGGRAAEKEISISGEESAAKSAPDFFRRLEFLSEESTWRPRSEKR